MKLVILCLVVGFFGVILFLKGLQKHGELTERRFAVVVVTYWSIFTISSFLILSTTSTGIIIGVVLSSLWYVLGYPMARWIYRQVFPRQSPSRDR